MKYLILFPFLIFFNSFSYAQKNNPNQAVNKKPNNQKVLAGSTQVIKEVKIGDQIWMGTNLNVDKFRNGDVIPQVKTKEEWKKAGENKQPVWCYYDFKPVNGAKYGKLYNWFAVNDTRGLAPKGWHVPNKYEFKILVNFFGGLQEASAKLKSNSGWGNSKSGGDEDLKYCPQCDGLGKVTDDDDRYVTCGRCRGEGLVVVKTPVTVIKGNGVNSINLNVAPSGCYNYDGGFKGVGYFCLWWTTTVKDTSSANYFTLNLNYKNSSTNEAKNFMDGGSVRCVKGEQAAIYEFKETPVIEVKIGRQKWMGTNLDVYKFRNGDSIPEAKTEEEWKKARDNKQPAWCYNDFDPSQGSKYGKLYNWYAVNDARGLAPNGWHVPSRSEWDTLTNYIGEYYTDKRMKSENGWKNGRNGTNLSGFSGLPGGSLNQYTMFVEPGLQGSWWSSTETNDDFQGIRYYAYSLSMRYDDSEVKFEFLNTKSDGLSVRCVKDY